MLVKSIFVKSTSQTESSVPVRLLCLKNRTTLSFLECLYDFFWHLCAAFNIQLELILFMKLPLSTVHYPQLTSLPLTGIIYHVFHGLETSLETKYHIRCQHFHSSYMLCFCIIQIISHASMSLSINLFII